MKTQSIKSIATLLGVAITLSVSALAGPDPSTRFPLRTVSQPNQGEVSIAFGGQAVAEKKHVVAPRVQFVQTPNPHGGVTYSYRGVAAETW